MARWALLHHELPDGSWHFDWMLEDASHPEGALVTFRVLVRPDMNSVQAFDAQRLTNHRRAYLDFQGPVSGNRGTVRRIAEGTCAIEADGPVFQVLLIEAGLRWVGVRREPAPDLYRFTLQT